MIPSGRLIGVVIVLAGLGVALAFGRIPSLVWQLAAVAAAVVALVDLLLVLRRGSPELERRVHSVLSLGRSSPVELVLKAPHAARVRVFDLHPGGWEQEGLPVELGLRAARASHVTYHVRPLARGRETFEGCHLRIRSPLALWWHQRTLPVRTEIKVYPDFERVSRFAFMGVESTWAQTGARLQRRRGEGIEFHQLRDYRDGDALRQIDWKASSRMKRLISKEYQDERDQQVVIMLDTGRRMLAKDDELSHFDHCLNAALLLAYIALREGDAVGLMSFGHSERWLPPVKGAGAMNSLLGGTYDLEVGSGAVEYTAAATALVAQQRRRALVVLLTNVRDEDTADLLPALQLLRRRHEVLVASLREQALDDRATLEVVDIETTLQRAGVLDYLAARRRAHSTLGAAGANVQDVTCSQLPRALITQYLDAKRSGRL